MDRKQMLQFIADNQAKIYEEDAYYIQFMQAEAVLRALQQDIENGSPTANTDMLIFTIGTKVLPISLWNAESISSIDQMLLEIQRDAFANILVED